MKNASFLYSIENNEQFVTVGAKGILTTVNELLDYAKKLLMPVFSEKCYSVLLDEREFLAYILILRRNLRPLILLSFIMISLEN
jgi:hypothetical protein